MNNEYENGLYGTNLKYFKSGSAFLEYVDDTSSAKEYPNAAIIDNETQTKRDPKVIYNWELTERQRYELQYFTIKVAGQGTTTVTCKIPPQLDTTCLRTISYSTDGENWTTVQNTDNRTNDINILTDPIGSGQAVMFKADADYLSVYDYNEDVYCGLTFSTSGSSFDIEGNIMSLFYGDDFINKDEITPNYNANAAQMAYSTMGYLFYKNTDLHSAKNLILPNKVTEHCYEDMFEGCEALVEAPELPATELAERCYSYMFSGCTSLVNAPELPATELADNCYSNMFYGCESLTEAPELPATKLSVRCYEGMFRDCTSLVNAPELPATELANYCYSNMFEGCTSLAVAPDLPAIELVTSCYSYMFDGCTHLHYIKMMAKKISRNNAYMYTQYWVKNVSNSGTFIKNEDAEYSSFNQHAIPRDRSYKWTVITEKPTEIESDNELVLTYVSNPIVYGILSDGGLDSRHADPNGWTADELASLTLEDIYNYNGISGGTGNNARSIFYCFDNDYGYNQFDPSDIEGKDRMWTFDEFKYFKGISIIPEECFRGCWGLKSITIPSSVVYIQEYAFHDCWWLEKITLEDSDNKLTIDDGLYSNDTISKSAFYYAGLRYFHDTEDWDPTGQLAVSEKDLIDGRYTSTIDRLKKTNVLIGDRTVISRYQ